MLAKPDDAIHGICAPESPVKLFINLIVHIYSNVIGVQQQIVWGEFLVFLFGDQDIVRRGLRSFVYTRTSIRKKRFKKKN